MKVERVILDTNVLISAALLEHSTPAKLLSRVCQEHRLVFSDDTFAELETRLWRPKFDRYLSLEDRRLLLHDLAAIADWVDISPEEAEMRFSRDPDDDKFVVAARAAGARWLVSGDQDLLLLRTVGPIEIITPAQALALLGQAGT